MANVNLTTTPTTLDAGTAAHLVITNTSSGGEDVDILRGGVHVQRLRFGQKHTIQPEGVAVTGKMTSGSGSVDVVTTAATTTVNTVAASGAAQTLPDLPNHDITLTANCTLTFPAAAKGKTLNVVLRQDGTGSRLVTWPGTAKFASATAPLLSTVASRVDVIQFLSIDGTNWLGSFPIKDAR